MAFAINDVVVLCCLSIDLMTARLEGDEASAPDPSVIVRTIEGLCEIEEARYRVDKGTNAPEDVPFGNENHTRPTINWCQKRSVCTIK